MPGSLCILGLFIGAENQPRSLSGTEQTPLFLRRETSKYEGSMFTKDPTRRKAVELRNILRWTSVWEKKRVRSGEG